MFLVKILKKLNMRYIDIPRIALTAHLLLIMSRIMFCSLYIFIYTKSLSQTKSGQTYCNPCMTNRYFLKLFERLSWIIINHSVVLPNLHLYFKNYKKAMPKCHFSGSMMKNVTPQISRIHYYLHTSK